MRSAIAENIWELLLSCILLVFVTGIAFFLYSQYRCRARLNLCTATAKNIEDAVAHAVYSGLSYYVRYVRLAALNSTHCRIYLQCTGNKLRLTVVCPGCGNRTLALTNFSLPCTPQSLVLQPPFTQLKIVYTGKYIEFSEA
ncbi:MAG: hypothetical protein GXO42_02760 [bacterium]|nr:hypothetical protein [bacterium]